MSDNSMSKIAEQVLTYLTAKVIAEIIFETDKFIKENNEVTLLVCKAVCKHLAQVLDDMTEDDIDKIRGK